MMPKTVWLQSGIRNPQVEEELAHAGIKVVADRCLKVEREAAMSARRHDEMWVRAVMRWHRLGPAAS